MDPESSLQMGDEFPRMDEESTLRMDERGTNCLHERGTIYIDEAVTPHTDLSPVAPSMDRNPITTEEEQLVLQSDKFTLAMLSFSTAFSKWKQSYVITTKLKNRKRTGLERITKALGTKANFDMDTDLEIIKTARKDLLQKISKNRHHQIKKKYFVTIGANKVSMKSPLPNTTGGEWQELVEMWSTPTQKKEERKGEELSTTHLFKATHNSKKHGFSEPVKIAILEMEKMKDAPVHEVEEPKFAAEIVNEVLKTEVKESTFNVGLQSSRNNSSKASVVVATHVCDLEKKPERSDLQDDVMKEELVAIRMKSEEAEAAREKEFELLRKKSQEQDATLSDLMALFGGKAYRLCSCYEMTV
ncbi:hypothetical protein D1007_09756 [Hordeum vulgare]|nr:hypothetical protein D1007_09756 [Hordeum vulgare]